MCSRSLGGCCEEVEVITLEDLKSIIESIGRKIKGKVLEAYVFGSVVEGYAVKNELDLDLIIVPKTREDWFELLSKEISALLDAGIVPHLHPATNQSYERLLEVARKKG
jgi:predicted nucleotidyltransferase